jgi:glyoxylase-like metal-dependent hydrolase (beta-lactamase superfamily II)
MRVTDNTYILSGMSYSTGDPATLGNVYGIRTSRGMILVDCGLPEVGLKMIEESLDYYKIDDPITHVLLTHAHIDHCGNAKYYQDKGAKIIVGAGDVDYLCKAGGFNLFHETSYQTGTYHIFPAFTPDIAIGEDQEMVINGLTFKFITTPGHSAGSLAILLTIDGKTMLFSGDSFYPIGGRSEIVNLGWRGDPKYNSNDLINSLIKLSDTVETDMLLAGHGNVLFRNATKFIHLAARTAYQTLRY